MAVRDLDDELEASRPPSGVHGVVVAGSIPPALRSRQTSSAGTSSWKSTVSRCAPSAIFSVSSPPQIGRRADALHLQPRVGTSAAHPQDRLIVKPRILVIDDEGAIRDSLRMILEYEDYQFRRGNRTGRHRGGSAGAA